MAKSHAVNQTSVKRKIRGMAGVQSENAKTSLFRPGTWFLFIPLPSPPSWIAKVSLALSHSLLCTIAQRNCSTISSAVRKVSLFLSLSLSLSIFQFLSHSLPLSYSFISCLCSSLYFIHARARARHIHPHPCDFACRRISRPLVLMNDQLPCPVYSSSSPIRTKQRPLWYTMFI